MITIDNYWLTLLLSVVLPMVVALVTKQAASGAFKSIVLLALAVITGTLTSIQQQGGTFDWKAALLNTAVSFVIAVGVHYGLLKQVNLTGREGVIQNAVPGGLGKHEVDLAA